MKYTYIVFVLFVFIASCKMPVFEKAAPIKPYLTLKDGKRLISNNIHKQLINEKDTYIMFDSSAYRPEHIRSFSDGVNTFAIYKENQIVKKMVDGKINIYTSNLSKKTEVKPLYQFNYFLEKDTSHIIEEINYNNLKNIIPPNAAASSYLKKYNNQKKLINAARIVSVTSILFGGYKFITPKSGAQIDNNTGLVIGACGVGMIFTLSGIKEGNRNKLFKAIKEFNK